MHFLRVLGPVLAAGLVVAACGDGAATDDDGGSSGASGGETSSSGGNGSTSSGGSNGASSSSSSGGPGTCNPGEKSACHIDPCSPGEATCNAEGTGFGTCQGETRSCTGATEFSRRYGNSDQLGYSEELRGAVGLPDNSRYLVGTFLGSVDFSPAGALAPTGSPNGFLAKVAADGTPLWARTPSALAVVPYAVATDAAGNVTIAGEFRGPIDFGNGPIASDVNYTHIFVASWFANGNLRWGKVFGSGSAYHRATAIAVDAQGAVYIGGNFNSTVNFGGNLLTATSGSVDAFVAKLDANGEHVWSRRFGDDSQQITTGLAVDVASGDVFVTSQYGGAIDFGGGALSQGGGNAFSLARLAAADGAHRWSKNLGACNGGNLHIRRAPNGNVLVFSDTFALDVDFGNGLETGTLLASYSATGVLQWGKTFEAALEWNGAAVDSSNSIVLAGRFEDALDLGAGPITSFGGSNDAVFAKFSDAGQLIWARAVGDSDQQSNSQRGMAVTFGDSLRPTVLGDFLGNINFGDRELVSGGGYGGSDLFLAQLSP